MTAATVSISSVCGPVNWRPTSNTALNVTVLPVIRVVSTLSSTIDPVVPPMALNVTFPLVAVIVVTVMSPVEARMLTLRLMVVAPATTLIALVSPAVVIRMSPSLVVTF